MTVSSSADSNEVIKTKIVSPNTTVDICIPWYRFFWAKECHAITHGVYYGDKDNAGFVSC